MSKFVAESYTNDIGQILNPGDQVIYVGTGRCRTSVKRGTFEGIHRGIDSWNKDKVVSIRIGNIPCSRYVKDGVYTAEEAAERNKPYTWNVYKAGSPKYKTVENVRKAILPLCRAYKVEGFIDNLEKINL